MSDDTRRVEYLTPSDEVVHHFCRVLFQRRTEYQQLEIVESRTHGKVLLLDGTWQSCTADEFVYHEALVHPAMIRHGRPRSVFILGGGEGATAREVLRWRSVKRVLMVDIDGEVVQACREHLPEMHGGAFDDPRLQLEVGDALELLERSSEQFDVVISDLSDPLEEGPSLRLFTREYFERARRVVAPGGIFVVQAGSIAPAELRVHARLHCTVATCFDAVRTHQAFVPSFGTPWGFIVATHARSEPSDAATRSPEHIDHVLAYQVAGDCRWATGATIAASGTLPPYVLRALRDPSLCPYTLDDPPRYGSSA